jgi:hypothetical protein
VYLLNWLEQKNDDSEPFVNMNNKKSAGIVTLKSGNFSSFLGMIAQKRSSVTRVRLYFALQGGIVAFLRMKITQMNISAAKIRNE